MNEKIRIPRRVSFLLEEDQILREQAGEAGMSVSAFIRQQTLKGQVMSIEGEVMRRHSEQISRIGELIAGYIDRHHADVWMYEADLERIHEELSRIRNSEVDLIEQICSGM